MGAPAAPALCCGVSLVPRQAGGMGASAAEHDFYWVADAEPHARRRKAILAKYGEQVRALYGYDVSTAYQARPGLLGSRGAPASGRQPLPCFRLDATAAASSGCPPRSRTQLPPAGANGLGPEAPQGARSSVGSPPGELGGCSCA